MHGYPDQQHRQYDHANVTEQAVSPHLLTGLQALVHALAHQHQYLPVLAAVMKIAPQRHQAYLVVTVHGVVNDRITLAFRQQRRPGKPRHAHQGLAGQFAGLAAGKRRRDRQDLFHPVIFAVARTRLQHDLHVIGGIDHQAAARTEFNAVFQHFGRFKQGVVVDILNEEIQRTVVVAAIDHQQEDHTGYEQYEQPETHAPAGPGFRHYQFSGTVLSSM